MPDASRPCQLIRWTNGVETTRDDLVSVEEPLQVIIDGRPLAVLMRTPGDDELLVMGFLLTEGIIDKASQVRRIDLEARDNHALVFLIDDHQCDWERLTRHLFSASSCGLCGKATIDAILQSHPPIETKPVFDPAVIQKAPDIMRAAQANFDSTGGIHASGIFSKDGELLVLREDIGRHNALDKVIGEGLMKGLDFPSLFPPRLRPGFLRTHAEGRGRTPPTCRRNLGTVIPRRQLCQNFQSKPHRLSSPSIHEYLRIEKKTIPPNFHIKNTKTSQTRTNLPTR